MVGIDQPYIMMYTTCNMQRTQIYLTPAQHDFLSKKAQENKTSLADEVRKAIEFVRQKNQLNYQDEANSTAGQTLLKLHDQLQKQEKYSTKRAENKNPNTYEQYLLEDYERIQNYYR